VDLRPIIRVRRMRWYMLPMWFGQERSLLEYVHGTSYLPTFVSTEANAINGFACSMWPDPSIERAPQRLLGGLWSATHVERLCDPRQQLFRSRVHSSFARGGG
jgi:hypothetical protein